MVQVLLVRWGIKPQFSLLRAHIAGVEWLGHGVVPRLARGSAEGSSAELCFSDGWLVGRWLHGAGNQWLHQRSNHTQLPIIIYVDILSTKHWQWTILIYRGSNNQWLTCSTIISYFE